MRRRRRASTPPRVDGDGQPGRRRRAVDGEARRRGPRAPAPATRAPVRRRGRTSKFGERAAALVELGSAAWRRRSIARAADDRSTAVGRPSSVVAVGAPARRTARRRAPTCSFPAAPVAVGGPSARRARLSVDIMLRRGLPTRSSRSAAGAPRDATAQSGRRPTTSDGRRTSRAARTANGVGSCPAQGEPDRPPTSRSRPRPDAVDRARRATTSDLSTWLRAPASSRPAPPPLVRHHSPDARPSSRSPARA